MTDRIRIALLSLHSCPWDRPGGRYTGGMNIYIQDLCRELAKRGHAVDIYTCSHPADEECRHLQLNENIRLFHINSAGHSMVTEAYLDEHINRLTQSILSLNGSLNTQYDLIHSHYWLSGLVGNQLKKSWQIPHITMFHTLGALKNNAGLGALEPDYRILNERIVIESCDHIIASTEREKHELITRYSASGGIITVVPCGINLELFRPVDKQLARSICHLDAKTTVLFVGRQDPLKGLNNLLEAVSSLDYRNDFQLLIIGGNDRYMAENWPVPGSTNKNSLDDKVIFAGSIPHEKMYLYYNSADFCVVPSYYESFSLVAMESVACGTPVMATAVGEMPDLARICNYCRIITDNKPANLAQHINAMLNDIGNCHNNGVGKLIGPYGWDSVTNRIIAGYESVLAASLQRKEATLLR